MKSRHIPPPIFHPKWWRLVAKSWPKTPVSGLEIKVGDLKTFADKTGGFDVVMGLNLFHLVENPTSAFSQIHGMLAQDGLFISKTACLADEPKFLKRMMFRVMVAVVGTLRLVPRPIHCFPRSRIRGDD